MKKYQKPDVMITLLGQADCLAASGNSGLVLEDYDFSREWL